MSKIIDFDQFRAEREKRPVIFRVGGIDYELPPTLPADMGVAVIELQRDMGADAKVPPEKIFEFCEAVFGEELWAIIMKKHRVTLEELPALLYAVLEAYTAEDADDPKDQASPTSPTPRSSSTSSKAGRRSKPTS